MVFWKQIFNSHKHIHMVIKDIGLSCCNKRGCECVILFRGGIFRSDFVFRFILHSRLIFISLNLLPGWILEFMAFRFFFLYFLPAHEFFSIWKKKFISKWKQFLPLLFLCSFFSLALFVPVYCFRNMIFFYIEKHFFFVQCPFVVDKWKL